MKKLRDSALSGVAGSSTCSFSSAVLSSAWAFLAAEASVDCPGGRFPAVSTATSTYCDTILGLSVGFTMPLLPKGGRLRPVKEQQIVLSRKLQWHYAYYGVTGNFSALQRFYDRVKKIWHKWLSRRNNRGIGWQRMSAILKAFPLRRPRVVHSALKRPVAKAYFEEPDA